MSPKRANPKLELPRQIELGSGLRLRRLSTDDSDVIFSAVAENRDYLDKWLPWVENTSVAGDTRRFLEEVEKKSAEGVTLAYGLWEGEAFRGIIGMHDVNAANANLQIGYWLAEAAQGKGLMTRACAAVVRVAFETLEMERVEIRCATGNDRSSGVPERLGFKLEGVARHAQKLRGRFADMKVYSLLRREWAVGSAAKDVKSGL